MLVEAVDVGLADKTLVELMENWATLLLLPELATYTASEAAVVPQFDHHVGDICLRLTASACYRTSLALRMFQNGHIIISVGEG